MCTFRTKCYVFLTIDSFQFQVGVEGKGLEPTVEALFGPNGFFPDTVMKTFYYAADKMPPQINNILRNIIPGLRNDRKKRQVLHYRHKCL